MHAFSHRVDIDLWQANGLAHITHGAGVAILNKRADHRSAIGRVLLEYMTEHLCPCLAAEVEVHVRHVRLRTFITQEALDCEVVLHRVDTREAEQVADDRAYGRTAAPYREVIVVSVAQ